MNYIFFLGQQLNPCSYIDWKGNTAWNSNNSYMYKGKCEHKDTSEFKCTQRHQCIYIQTSVCKKREQFMEFEILYLYLDSSLLY